MLNPSADYGNCQRGSVRTLYAYARSSDTYVRHRVSAEMN